MRELSLFTGAGGGVLGTKLLGWETKGYVEYESYCQKIIRQRIEDGILDAAPIFGDIRAFVNEGYAGAYQGMVDVVTAGFPCQPFSVAGKRQGADDERNMWPATLAVIRAVRPRYCFLENVPGLIVSGYFGTILGGLAESGYDCRWRILSAAEMGAPHKRDRLWLIAYAGSIRCNTWGTEQSFQGVRAYGEASVAYPSSQRRRRGDNGNAAERKGEVQAQGPRPGKEQSRLAGVAGGSEEGYVGNAKSKRIQRVGQEGVQNAEEVAGPGISIGTGGRIAWWDEDPAVMADTGQRGNHWRSDRPSRRQREPEEIVQNDRRGGRKEDGEQPAEPYLGRVAYGMAHRVDRLKAIGNGQVPAVAALAWRLLTEDLETKTEKEPGN